MRARGFTLVELLVTISILAIIAAIGFVSYSQAQANSRDVRRKQDLRAIATALELYYAANKQYPLIGSNTAAFTVTGNYIVSTNPAQWFTALTGSPSYINTIPVDPLNTGSPMQTPDDENFGYYYWTNNITCGAAPNQFRAQQYYFLASKLENSYDPEAHRTKVYKDCAGGNFNIAINGLFVISIK